MQRRIKGAIHRAVTSAVRVWAAMLLRRGEPICQEPIEPPKRILLVNGAHIGDIVISTSLLPVLRSAYPDAEFGFLTGSWSSAVVKDHPEVSFTHTIDHWRLNRARIPIWTKLLRSWSTRRRALEEIRRLNYDLSLCLHSWYPDLLHMMWYAGIPRRLGFAHSWFAPFATGVTECPKADFIHQGARIARVLDPLQIGPEHLGKRRSILAPTTPAAECEVSHFFEMHGLENSSYVVVHIGSGEPARELSPAFWREVAAELSRDRVVVFTGRGPRENAVIATVIEGLDRCISACDRLSWDGFVTAIRHAEMLYGVESMAGHVAAAVGTPCTVVYTGTAGVARWRPEGQLCTVFTQHVPCAPCGITSGCNHMTCIRALTPENVLQSRRSAGNQPSPGQSACQHS